MFKSELEARQRLRPYNSSTILMAIAFLGLAAIPQSAKSASNQNKDRGKRISKDSSPDSGKSCIIGKKVSRWDCRHGRGCRQGWGRRCGKGWGRGCGKGWGRGWGDGRGKGCRQGWRDGRGKKGRHRWGRGQGNERRRGLGLGLQSGKGVGLLVWGSREMIISRLALNASQLKQIFTIRKGARPRITALQDRLMLIHKKIEAKGKSPKAAPAAQKILGKKRAALEKLLCNVRGGLRDALEKVLTPSQRKGLRRRPWKQTRQVKKP